MTPRETRARRRAEAREQPEAPEPTPREARARRRAEVREARDAPLPSRAEAREAFDAVADNEPAAPPGAVLPCIQVRRRRPALKGLFLLYLLSFLALVPFVADPPSAEEHARVVQEVFSLRQNPDLSPIPRSDLTTDEWRASRFAWQYNPHLPLAWDEFAALVSHYPLTFPSVALQVRETNNQARGFRNDLWQVPGGVVQKNAYRHAFWTFQLTKQLGPDFALALSNAHESGHPDLTIEGPFDHVTDKINNLVGVKLASHDDDAAAAIEDAWGRGHLAWADNFRVEEDGRQTADVHFQAPLDNLWARYRERPAFDARELRTLQQLGIQLPG